MTSKLIRFSKNCFNNSLVEFSIQFTIQIVKCFEGPLQNAWPQLRLLESVSNFQPPKIHFQKENQIQTLIFDVVLLFFNRSRWAANLRAVAQAKHFLLLQNIENKHCKPQATKAAYCKNTYTVTVIWSATLFVEITKGN